MEVGAAALPWCVVLLIRGWGSLLGSTAGPVGHPLVQFTRGGPPQSSPIQFQYGIYLGTSRWVGRYLCRYSHGQISSTYSSTEEFFLSIQLFNRRVILIHNLRWHSFRLTNHSFNRAGKRKIYYIGRYSHGQISSTYSSTEEFFLSIQLVNRRVILVHNLRWHTFRLTNHFFNRAGKRKIYYICLYVLQQASDFIDRLLVW